MRQHTVGEPAAMNGRLERRESSAAQFLEAFGAVVPLSPQVRAQSSAYPLLQTIIHLDRSYSDSSRPSPADDSPLRGSLRWRASRDPASSGFCSKRRRRSSIRCSSSVPCAASDVDGFGFVHLRTILRRVSLRSALQVRFSDRSSLELSPTIVDPIGGCADCARRRVRDRPRRAACARCVPVGGVVREVLSIRLLTRAQVRVDRARAFN